MADHLRVASSFNSNSDLDPPPTHAYLAGYISSSADFDLFILTAPLESSYLRMEAPTGPLFTKFSGLVDLWVEMIDRTFTFRSLEGRCYGNQFWG